MAVVLGIAVIEIPADWCNPGVARSSQYGQEEPFAMTVRKVRLLRKRLLFLTEDINVRDPGAEICRTNGHNFCSKRNLDAL